MSPEVLSATTISTWIRQSTRCSSTAQYVENATAEQTGRLRSILENVAGLLRGENNGVLMTQVDANPQDSAPGSGSPNPATYSDDVVSTQCSGQDQRKYITIPWDVQWG